MFDFLRRKKQEQPQINFSVVKVDLHSHLIPGIDDGSPDMETSLDLIWRLADLGFEKLITTPHVMADYYRNSPDTILKGVDLLREEVLKNNIPIEIEAAAEYYLDETLDGKIARGEVLTLKGQFLLFELSFLNSPQSFFDTIKKIQDNGLKPILAHPERYGYFSGSLENYQRIKAEGCYLQLNTLSLSGYYGKSTQKTAEELVDNLLVDFIGTDLHHVKHAAALKQALGLPYVKHLLTEYQLQNQLLL